MLLLLSRALPAAWLALAMALPLIGGIASAQEDESPVRARLVEQSVWNGPKRPLVLSFSATNGGEAALDDLLVVLSIHSPARSRSVYEFSLERDETAPIFAFPFPQPGALEPGQSRTFRIRQPLDVLADRGETALYPLKVQLLSRDVPVATVRTPMVFLVERPETPLDLVWTWLLTTPLQHDPDGRFRPGPLPADIASGGRLDAMIGALEELSPAEVDVALSPVLADQLGRMADGFELVFPDGTEQEVDPGAGAAADAARLLDALRRLAGRPGTELVALPAGEARLPSLVAAGLGADVPRLVEEGRELVASVVDARPSPTVLRPPLSQLDAETAALLSGAGVRTLLLDPNALPEIPGEAFSPPAVIHLSGAGPSPVAIVPDPAVPRVVGARVEDPRLAAQVALGQLAAVWLEFPGSPGRGAAVLFGEQQEYPAPFFRAFARLVRASPWLDPTTAGGMVSSVREPGQRALPRRTYRPIPRSYVERVVAARRALSVFSATVQGAEETKESLDAMVDTAEGAVALVQPEAGLSFVDAALREVRRTYDRVEAPPLGSLLTLTSQGGTLPVTIANESPFSLRVVVRFVADRRLAFPSGNARAVSLPGDKVTLLRVPVRAQATGRFPIRVQVTTAASAGAVQTISETELIVRSTAYNRIALFLTVGAAVFLLAWWGRRFLPRPRT